MHEKLLIMELDGRLGNQLFIFAVGYALARELNAILVFSSLKIQPKDLLLPQVIGSLYREATKSELLEVGKYPYKNIFLQKINRKIVNLIRQLQGDKPAIFSKDSSLAFDYDPETLSLDLPVYLTGFFQNEKYFSHHSAEIFSAVFSHLNQTSKASQLLEPIEHPVVAISFRRGEYNSIGWSLPLEYYDRALDYLNEHTTIGTLLLFGDDWDFLDLVGERWSNSYSVLSALTLGSDPISQLSLMSDCEHCIVANSSFSWWGAWFGDWRYRDTARIVIAPDGWINGGLKSLTNSNQILPDRWVKLQFDNEPQRELAISIARFEDGI